MFTDRALYGLLILLVASGFILSGMIRKGMRAVLIGACVMSLALVAICLYALVNSGGGGSRDSAGLLFFILGIGFFGFTALMSYRMQARAKAYEVSHFAAMDHIASPIPIPPAFKDAAYALGLIAVYVLFFASPGFYRSHLLSVRDALAIALLPATYFFATRVFGLRRPLEGVSRVKESLLFTGSAMLSLFLVYTTLMIFVRSELSVARSGVQMVTKTNRFGFKARTPLEKDFRAAIKKGDVEAVKKMIEEGVSLNASPQSLDAGPLNLALNERQNVIAQTLIYAGAHVDEKALQLAIIKGNGETVRVALTVNKSLPQNCEGCVEAAARLGDPELAEYLLTQISQKSDPSRNVFQEAMRALMTMPHWEKDKLEAFSKTYDILVRHGASAEASSSGYLMLSEFANRMHLYSDRFTLLKVKGANLNIQDKDGNTYLHLAAIDPYGSYDKLIALGLDPSIKNLAGETPADIMARSNPEKRHEEKSK